VPNGSLCDALRLDTDRIGDGVTSGQMAHGLLSSAHVTPFAEHSAG
jgi:hypothetical protein